MSETVLAWAWLLLALISAAGFYLATAHQRLRAPLSLRAARVARWLACVALAASAAAAMPLFGRWPGLFASLSALMAACVALPALDQGLRLLPGRAAAATAAAQAHAAPPAAAP